MPIVTPVILKVKRSPALKPAYRAKLFVLRRAKDWAGRRGISPEESKATCLHPRAKPRDFWRSRTNGEWDYEEKYIRGESLYYLYTIAWCF